MNPTVSHPTLGKVNVAAALQEIRILLELKGGRYFQARAYKAAARVLADLESSVTSLIKENRLTAISCPNQRTWGHALGPIIQHRPPFNARVEEILDVIAESPVAIEINGDLTVWTWSRAGYAKLESARLDSLLPLMPTQLTV